MKNKKLYLYLIFTLCFIIVILIFMNLANNGVFTDVIERVKDRKSALYSDVKKDEIRLKIDGELIQLKYSKLYIEENYDVLVPLTEISTLFKCAVNSVSENEIQIQKGNIIVDITGESSVISYNDNSLALDNSMKMVDDVYYINAKIFENCFGYESSWNKKEKCLELVDTKRNENFLPSRYSYKDTQRMPAIKNQENHSTCWAFASTFAMESSIMPFRNVQLSEDHMIWNNGLITSYKSGGEYTRAMAYLAAWKGPVDSLEDAYGDYETNENAKPIVKLQEIQIIENKNIEAIKKAVFLTGGVETSLYTTIKYKNNISKFYNEEKYSYCYIGTKRPNHEVVIVGWDDNFSKENFSNTVPGDGAFICASSWGEDFGDNGIFYVSYYDSNIGITNILYSGYDFDNRYDRIYQSDICGWVGQMGFDEDTAFFANAYTACEDEQIEAVGFYATGKDTSYEIYVVNNFKDVNSFNSKKLVKSGKLTNAGYYTIDFDEEVSISAGEKYAVVVKITTPGAIHPIAIEYQAGYFSRNVDISDGEGYISMYGRNWEHIEETKSCNVCLKAYTKIKKNQ